MESAEFEGGLKKLPRGALAELVATLTPEQRKLWRPVRRAMKETAARAAARGLEPRLPKDVLYDALNQATGKVTAEAIERLIDNAVEKGDVQALRVMAQMAGMDLAERPKEVVGPGAKVIIIRPEVLPLTLAQEDRVRKKIASLDV